MRSLPKLGITGRFALYLALISVVPLLVGASAYQISRSILQEEVSGYTEELVAEYALRVDRMCVEIEGMMTNLAGLGELRHLLQTEVGAGDDYLTLRTQAEVAHLLDGYLHIDGLATIDVFTPDGDYFHVGDPIEGSEIRADEEARLMAASAASSEPVAWLGVERHLNASSRYDLVLPAVQAISALDIDTHEERTLGYLVASYDPHRLHQQFAHVDLGEGAFLAIIDTAGRLLFHPDEAQVGRALSPAVFADIQAAEASFTAIIDGQEVFVSTSRAAHSGWYVVSFIPTASLTGRADQIRDTTIWITCGGLLFIALIAYSLARRVVQPLRQLSAVFQKMEDGSIDWQARFQSDRGDEIGELMRWFDTFMDNLADKRAAEEALIRAKEAAEAANQAKGIFLANMSHELRTPLNGIMGMTALALESHITDEQREYLSVAQTSAQWLLTLVSDLLDVSRIDAGKLELDRAQVAVRSECGVALRALALAAHQRGVELVLVIDSDVPEVVIGDARRMMQIMNNLVGNAIKFTERGEVVVSLSSAPVAPNADGDAGDADGDAERYELTLTVRDTGVGIAADQLSVIFEMFSQGDSSLTRKYGGSGLGLVIASRLAGLMGGRVWVESEGVGAGSTFYATMRVDRAEVADPARDALTKRARCAGDKSVLVVDDNRSACEALAATLSALGYQVDSAADGDAALALMERAERRGGPYHMVFIDAVMPGMSGFALAEAMPHERARAVMLLTMERFSADLAHRQALEIGHYLIKPIQERELLELMAEAAEDPDADAEPALRVLLVEDNLLDQRITAALLERHGYRVQVVEHGAAALERLADGDERFDLICMELQLPIMDGFEAAAAIRASEQAGERARVPIIAVSAHAEEADRVRCEAVGVDALVAKPVVPTALYEAIEAVRARAAAAAADERG
ncbi:MAG: hypothetical protein Tsb0020_29510 [Haliangiales bacterium]